MAKEKKTFEDKKTKVVYSDYKGSKMFGVWEVDDNDETVSDFPIVSFGLTKAKAVLKHIDELTLYAEGK
jgi:muconolactone delta-isomerase